MMMLLKVELIDILKKPLKLLTDRQSIFRKNAFIIIYGIITVLFFKSLIKIF